MRRATEEERQTETVDDISIHALHEESDLYIQHADWDDPLFQSTLSMRRATKDKASFQPVGVISIHALHEESDFTVWPLELMSYVFQSTLSMRRATRRPSRTPRRTSNFNPRSP